MKVNTLNLYMGSNSNRQNRMGGVDMKTIEERAKEFASKKADISLSAVYNEALASVYEEGYIAGAKEQKAIDGETMLKGFTTDELRVELKRRNAEEKAKKDSILRCRMCRHWGAINYWGNSGHYLERDTSRPCKFFKTKNGKNYRCHNASQLACEHFKRKEE